MNTEQVTLLCTFANSPAVFCPFFPAAPAAGSAEDHDTASADDAAGGGLLLDGGGAGGRGARGNLEYLIMPMQLPSQDDDAWGPES